MNCMRLVKREAGTFATLLDLPLVSNYFAVSNWARKTQCLHFFTDSKVFIDCLYYHVAIERGLERWRFHALLKSLSTRSRIEELILNMGQSKLFQNDLQQNKFCNEKILSTS
jgi:hypothetical protein